MQHGNHVRVTCDDPGMNEGIPVNRIFGPKSAEKRIGICQHFGVEKMVETQAGVALWYGSDFHVYVRHLGPSLRIRPSLRLDGTPRLASGATLACFKAPGAQLRDLGR